MMATGVTLKKRVMLETRKGLPERTYFAVLCAHCDETIGRVSDDATAQDRDQRVRLAKMAHGSTCRAVQAGTAWLVEGERGKRIARKRSDKYGKPMVVCRIEKRGVAWRWVVSCGPGARNMDTGYRDTMLQAMAAADECMATLIARGK